MVDTRAKRIARLHGRVRGVFGRVQTRLKSGVWSRPATRIRGAVVHTTESGSNTMRAIVDYFRRVGTQADSHYVLNDIPRKDGFVDVTRVVPEARKAWTALTANPYFVQYELVGRASQKRAYWLQHRREQIRTLGCLIAEDVLEYGFPVEMRKSPGVLGHVDLKRFGFFQTHTDPGEGFPWDVLRNDIRFYLDLSKLDRKTVAPVTATTVKRSVRKRSGHGATKAMRV